MTLARNAAYNFIGAALPALLSLITLPYIVRALGAEAFGLLTLVTAIVGYFAIIDVNMTAGATKYVAQFRASGDRTKLDQTVSFGFVVYLLIGLLGMLALLTFAEPLVSRILGVQAQRQAEAVLALQVAAFGFLFGQLQAYLNSLPGALMRYDVSGRIEAGFGTALPLLTVALLAGGFGLVQVVVLRVIMSALQAFALAVCLRRLLPGFQPAWPAAALRYSLLSFSGYAFLSRLAAVTYSQADKLLIGARSGLAAVAFYTVPATLSNRVMALVFRLSGVMFPHASAMAAAGRVDDLSRQYLAATRQLFFINGGIAVLLASLSEPILLLWMGPEFAAQGATVMVLIALAQWVDSMTNLPSLVNDGLGHPRVSGSFALARAALGLACISFGIGQAGIVGAAAGHLVASVVMSAAFLGYVHGRTVPVQLVTLLHRAYLVPMCVLLPTAALAVAMAPLASNWWRLLGVVAAVVALGLAGGWWWVLTPALRQRLGGLLHRSARA